MNQRKFAVIVDAYSAGNLLAPEFRSRGYECLHVQSTVEIWEVLLPTFRPDDFEANFAFDGSYEKLITQLRRYDIACVVPGTETGVELADCISESLGLATNGTELSAARRNKYLMIEAARARGLRVAAQVVTSNIDDIIGWLREHRFEKYVVKPVKSAGTDNVVICASEEEVRTAAETILGSVNKLGLPNDEVLVQEFLTGTEYFINTVSQDGTHRFTEIWRYRKRSINDRSFVYDCNELLPYDGLIQSQIRSYVLEVLKALNIQNGPAHTEVIMTSQGPALVESGARLDGLSVPAVNQACVGYGPLDLTVDAYTNPEAFYDKTEIPYRLKQHALTVYLTSYEEGTVDEIPGETRIRTLPSFFQMRLRVKPGSSVKRTADYFTAPGFVTLVHPDPRVIMADYEWIRGMENRRELLTVRSPSNVR